MATGKSMQATGQVGEYLAAAELCRMGFVATTFTRNVPEFDILAINHENDAFAVQVKTISSVSTTWQFSVDKFLDISVRDDVQIIHGKKNLTNPNRILIFIKLVSQGKDQFYILRLSDLQDIIYKGYRQYLEKHNGIRPRKPESMHTAVSVKDLKKYQDNWQLIHKEE